MKEERPILETRYLRTDQAAAYLGVSPRTLEKWRRLGTGPRFVRLGRRLVAYTRDDLDRWAESEPRRQR